MTRKKKRTIKKLIFFGVIAVIIVVIIAGFMARRKDSVNIMTTKVKMGEIERKLTETGNIELVRTVEVKSKIAGIVESILVEEGDSVKTGQVLCVIEPDPTQTLLLFQKRSAVDQRRIELDRTAKELSRVRELAKTSMVSGKEVEDAENAHRLAQNSFNLSKLELEIMEREIETAGAGAEERIVSSKVRSPMDGVITHRYIEEGVLVTSGMSSMLAGTNIFQVGDPSTKIIKANISEVDIGEVTVGLPVRIMLDAYPDTTFAGSIRHISPVGELQQGRNVVSFKTEVEIHDTDPRLKPGMSCDVDVIIDDVENIFYLPVESVYEHKDEGEESDVKPARILMFVKAEPDTAMKKSKGGMFDKFSSNEENPYIEFNEIEVKTGLRSESRIQIIADVDTTTAVATNAEKFYNDRKAFNKKHSDKKSDSKESGNDAEK